MDQATQDLEQVKGVLDQTQFLAVFLLLAVVEEQEMRREHLLH